MQVFQFTVQCDLPDGTDTTTVEAIVAGGVLASMQSAGFPTNVLARLDLTISNTSVANANPYAQPVKLHGNAGSSTFPGANGNGKIPPPFTPSQP